MLRNLISTSWLSKLEHVAEIALKSARGLDFIQRRGFTLWDFKPGNVLVALHPRDHSTIQTTEEASPFNALGQCFPLVCGSSTIEESFLVKITDFGTVTARESGECLGFTPQYASPETHALCSTGGRAGDVEDAAATQDAWSLGVVLLEMIRGKSCTWNDHVGARLALGTMEPELSSSRGLYLSIVRRCLDEDAQKRPAMATIIEDIQAAFESCFAAVGGESTPSLSPDDAGMLHDQVGGAFRYQLAGSEEDLELAGHHFREDVRIQEEAYGSESSQYAIAMSNLAGLLHAQGDFDGAKPHFERTIEIFERRRGPDHPNVATSLNNLAELLKAQGKYDEAKPLYERALRISEKSLGKDHATIAIWLNNLAELLKAQGLYGQAKPLYERSLEIRKKALGEDHPDVAGSLNNLAGLQRAQGLDTQARPLFERAIKIFEKALGRRTSRRRSPRRSTTSPGC